METEAENQNLNNKQQADITERSLHTPQHNTHRASNFKNTPQQTRTSTSIVKAVFGAPF
jgi:hypothetical protein